MAGGSRRARRAAPARQQRRAPAPLAIGVVSALLWGCGAVDAASHDAVERGRARVGALTRREEPESESRYSAEVPADGGDVEADEELKSEPLNRLYHYNDIEDADDMCGRPDLIATCGFADTTPFCFEEMGGERCYRGVCVCTDENRQCLDPVCSTPPADNVCPGPVCADDSKCISSRGKGWSCWHPCNWKHRVMDYGRDAAPIVEKIRITGRCKDMVDINEVDPDLDAGIRLASHEVPIIGGWSTANAGGASRRRAGPAEGEGSGAAARGRGASMAAVLGAVALGGPPAQDA